ncbi:MAG: hypothetical protein IPI30_21525 [Saprospiraceae bacterium]|nr:hypothetical protein [Candidatus Vicinibacter affinis]
MIVMPEHGRDEQHNSIKDLNDWFAYDHSGSPNARRIFNLMVGPGIDANLKVGSETNPIGDAADVVPTIVTYLASKIRSKRQVFLMGMQGHYLIEFNRDPNEENQLCITFSIGRFDLYIGHVKTGYSKQPF